MFFRNFSMAWVALLAVACVTPTEYGPAENGGGYGFSEQRIEQDRYRIDFCGNSFTSRKTVEAFLLFRAAEVTLDQGYDYFVIVESGMETQPFYSEYDNAMITRSGVGAGEFPYYPSGFDWAGIEEDEVATSLSYTAIAYVKMYKGEKPASMSNAFDAQQVYDNLRHKVRGAGA